MAVAAPVTPSAGGPDAAAGAAEYGPTWYGDAAACAGDSCASSSQTHSMISVARNAQKTQNIGVRPVVIVSPIWLACAGVRPNCSGDVAPLICTMAEIACPTIGTIAPAARAAPSRQARHIAAASTTATMATMTSTLPRITGPGFANALPAVITCEAPVAVRRVNLSHDGANAIAAPTAASTNVTSGTTSWLDIRPRRPASPRPETTPFPPGPAVTDRWVRNASPTPAVQASQPRTLSTSPAPIRWAPPAIGVPTSATKKPNVTALTPAAKSAPARSRVPPRAIRTALRLQAAR